MRLKRSCSAIVVQRCGLPLLVLLVNSRADTVSASCHLTSGQTRLVSNALCHHGTSRTCVTLRGVKCTACVPMCVLIQTTTTGLMHCVV